MSMAKTAIRSHHEKLFGPDEGVVIIEDFAITLDFLPKFSDFWERHTDSELWKSLDSKAKLEAKRAAMCAWDHLEQAILKSLLEQCD